MNIHCFLLMHWELCILWLLKGIIKDKNCLYIHIVLIYEFSAPRLQNTFTSCSGWCVPFCARRRSKILLVRARGSTSKSHVYLTASGPRTIWKFFNSPRTYLFCNRHNPPLSPFFLFLTTDNSVKQNRDSQLNKNLQRCFRFCEDENSIAIFVCAFINVINFIRRSQNHWSLQGKELWPPSNLCYISTVHFNFHILWFMSRFFQVL